MSDINADPANDKGLVGRLLSPVADVRRGEAGNVLLLTLFMFLALAAYYMFKTAREVFILTAGGAAVKSYSAAGQALLLLGLMPAYSAFASRVNRAACPPSRYSSSSNLCMFYVAVSRLACR